MPALIKLRYFLGLIIAMMFIAIFSMSFFYQGTDISKFLCKKVELERVQEAKIEAYSDQVLFGDERESVPEDIDLTEFANAEQGFLTTEKIRKVDKILILALTITAWLMLIPVLQNTRLLSFVYLILGIYIICLSVCKGINGGAIFSELSVPAHATRWLPCIAMWIWLFYAEKNLKLVTCLLIVASALTFAAHGYEAFNEHPKFKDLLYGGMNLFSIPLSDPICIILLKMIGIKDLCLSVAVLFCLHRWRWVLLWMAFWGFLTALARPIAFGDVSYLDALLRVGNGAIPLLIYLLLKLFKKLPTDTHETS